MIREIVMDTETTGLDPDSGHRLVELGAVELLNHLPSGQTFHSYINPERDMPEEAFRVHGLKADFLAGYPVFAEVVDAFLEFVGDSKVVIHNAGFDLKFINAELKRLDRDLWPAERAIDTLYLAQRRFPGSPASLDALCKRFGIDASARTKHGALLDSELLAEVYLHLLGGRQTHLGLALPGRREAGQGMVARTARPPRPHAASSAELEAHAAFLAELTDPLWQA